MDFFELMSISHRYMAILDPSTPDKMVKLGSVLGMRKGQRVLDFGCGCAEPLALWAEHFGVTGVGVDISQDFCQRARQQLAARGLADRIEIVCRPGSEYSFRDGEFDVATCIGATFVFGGFQQTVQALKRAVGTRGRLAVGEVYWQLDNVPPEYAQKETAVHPEPDLLRITREEGLEIEYVIRASRDDWDRYSSDNWHGLIRWLKDNPTHPDRDQVYQHLRTDQDDYFRFGRQYLGWAMYVLTCLS